jgi:hypothetical protein
MAGRQILAVRLPFAPAGIQQQAQLPVDRLEEVEPVGDQLRQQIASVRRIVTMVCTPAGNAASTALMPLRTGKTLLSYATTSLATTR